MSLGEDAHEPAPAGPRVRQHLRRRLVGQQVERELVAGPPVARDLEQRGAREAAVREQHVLAERRLAAARHHVERDAGERRAELEVLAGEAQRHQAGPRLRHREAELPGEARREVRGAELRDRETPGRHDERRRAQHPGAGLEHEVLARPHLAHLHAAADRDARLAALLLEHCHHLPRAAVAEQLPELLLVPGDAVALQLRHEVGRRVARERRAGEVRVLGEEALGRREAVREVAAPAARDQDLAPDLGVAFQHEDAALAPARLDRAHQAGRAAAEDDRVELRQCRLSAFSTRSPRRPDARLRALARA